MNNQSLARDLVGEIVKLHHIKKKYPEKLAVSETINIYRATVIMHDLGSPYVLVK